MGKRRGNCYVSSEALYHILGGKTMGWNVYRMRTKSDTHWWIEHDNGMILDPSRLQFNKLPNYSKGVRTGYLTKKPSKRARKLMKELTWQQQT